MNIIIPVHFINSYICGCGGKFMLVDHNDKLKDPNHAIGNFKVCYMKCDKCCNTYYPEWNMQHDRPYPVFDFQKRYNSFLEEFKKNRE